MLGKQVLVPLTSSLYVPGKLSDVENVVVDVGTGYYVKKVNPLLLFRIYRAKLITEQSRGDQALRR